MPKGRFYKPATRRGSKFQTMIVGGVELSHHDMVGEEVQVRWPDGYEETVTVDLGLFVDEDKPLWKPCFIKSIHGIELWFCFDQMRTIRIPK
jgi:hypothetical protein